MLGAVATSDPVAPRQVRTPNELASAAFMLGSMIAVTNLNEFGQTGSTAVRIGMTPRGRNISKLVTC